MAVAVIEGRNVLFDRSRDADGHNQVQDAFKPVMKLTYRQRLTRSGTVLRDAESAQRTALERRDSIRQGVYAVVCR